LTDETINYILEATRKCSSNCSASFHYANMFVTQLERRCQSETLLL